MSFNKRERRKLRGKGKKPKVLYRLGPLSFLMIQRQRGKVLGGRPLCIIIITTTMKNKSEKNIKETVSNMGSDLVLLQNTRKTETGCGAQHRQRNPRKTFIITFMF